MKKKINKLISYFIKPIAFRQGNLQVELVFHYIFRIDTTAYQKQKKTFKTEFTHPRLQFSHYYVCFTIHQQ